MTRFRAAFVLLTFLAMLMLVAFAARAELKTATSTQFIWNGSGSGSESNTSLGYDWISSARKDEIAAFDAVFTDLPASQRADIISRGGATPPELIGMFRGPMYVDANGFAGTWPEAWYDLVVDNGWELRGDNGLLNGKRLTMYGAGKWVVDFSIPACRTAFIDLMNQSDWPDIAKWRFEVFNEITDAQLPTGGKLADFFIDPDAAKVAYDAGINTMAQMIDQVTRPVIAGGDRNNQADLGDFAGYLFEDWMYRSGLAEWQWQREVWDIGNNYLSAAETRERMTSMTSNVYAIPWHKWQSDSEAQALWVAAMLPTPVGQQAEGYILYQFDWWVCDDFPNGWIDCGAGGYTEIANAFPATAPAFEYEIGEMLTSANKTGVFTAATIAITGLTSALTSTVTFASPPTGLHVRIVDSTSLMVVCDDMTADEYRFYNNNAGEDDSGWIPWDAAMPGPRWIDTGLEPGTEYTFSVQSRTDGIESLLADVVVNRTFDTDLTGWGMDGGNVGGLYGAGYEVWNLNDSGDGSLRDAISQSDRYVYFTVGGKLQLTSDDLRPQPHDNITIDGFSAKPFGGIQIFSNHRWEPCYDDAGNGFGLDGRWSSREAALTFDTTSGGDPASYIHVYNISFNGGEESYMFPVAERSGDCAEELGGAYTGLTKPLPPTGWYSTRDNVQMGGEDGIGSHHIVLYRLTGGRTTDGNIGDINYPAHHITMQNILRYGHPDTLLQKNMIWNTNPSPQEGTDSDRGMTLPYVHHLSDLASLNLFCGSRNPQVQSGLYNAEVVNVATYIYDSYSIRGQAHRETGRLGYPGSSTYLNIRKNWFKRYSASIPLWGAIVVENHRDQNGLGGTHPIWREWHMDDNRWQLGKIPDGYASIVDGAGVGSARTPVFPYSPYTAFEPTNDNFRDNADVVGAIPRVYPEITTYVDEFKTYLNDNPVPVDVTAPDTDPTVTLDDDGPSWREIFVNRGGDSDSGITTNEQLFFRLRVSRDNLFGAAVTDTSRWWMTSWAGAVIDTFEGGETYYVEAQSMNPAGIVGNWSPSVSFTQQAGDGEMPSQPTNIAYQTLSIEDGTEAVQVTWDASFDNVGIDRYEIMNTGTDPNALTPLIRYGVAQVNSNYPDETGLTYVDHRVTPGTYAPSYRVRAVDFSGLRGPWSDAQAVDETSPTWAIEPPDVAQGPGLSMIFTNFLGQDETTPEQGIRYRAVWGTTGIEDIANWNTEGWSDPGATSLTVSLVGQGNGTYNAVLECDDAAGNVSLPTSMVTQVVSGGTAGELAGPTEGCSSVCDGPPATVRVTSATDAYPMKFAVDCSCDNGASTAGDADEWYEFRVGPTALGPWTPYVWYRPEEWVYDDQPAGTDFYVQVFAHDGPLGDAGDPTEDTYSPGSAIGGPFSSGGNEPPDTPENLTVVATAGTPGALTISWDAVTDLDGPETVTYEGRNTSGTAGATEWYLWTATSIVDDGMAADTESCYQVRAYDGAAYSGWTAEVCGTTAADAVPMAYYVKPDGSDAADGTSPANAWQSFAKMNTIDDGDTLIVMEGTYLDSVQPLGMAWIDFLGDNVVIMADPDAATRPVIDFENAADETSPFIYNNGTDGSYGEIRGIDFKGWQTSDTNTSFMIFQDAASTGTKIVDCNFIDIQTSEYGSPSDAILWFQNAPGIEVDGCSFTGMQGSEGSAECAEHSVYVSGSDNSTLSNLTFGTESDLADSLGHPGSILAVSSDNLNVTGITSYNSGCAPGEVANGSDWMFFQNCDDLTVSDSQFYRDVMERTTGSVMAATDGIVVTSWSGDPSERVTISDIYVQGAGHGMNIAVAEDIDISYFYADSTLDDGIFFDHETTRGTLTNYISHHARNNGLDIQADSISVSDFTIRNSDGYSIGVSVDNVSDTGGEGGVPQCKGVSLSDFIVYEAEGDNDGLIRMPRNGGYIATDVSIDCGVVWDEDVAERRYFYDASYLDFSGLQGEGFMAGGAEEDPYMAAPDTLNSRADAANFKIRAGGPLLCSNIVPGFWDIYDVGNPITSATVAARLYIPTVAMGADSVYNMSAVAYRPSGTLHDTYSMTSATDNGDRLYGDNGSFIILDDFSIHPGIWTVTWRSTVLRKRPSDQSVDFLYALYYLREFEAGYEVIPTSEGFGGRLAANHGHASWVKDWTVPAAVPVVDATGGSSSLFKSKGKGKGK